MPRIDESLTKAGLKLGSVSDSAALDAEVLLCFVLKKERSYLRAWPEKNLNSEEQLAFESLVEQRFQGMPIAYLIGKREFWSREFKVNKDVLIPRADTELLIELSLAFIPKDEPYHVIDLGTGSGIIAITLAAERTNAAITAVDISKDALQIAKENAITYGLKNIFLKQSHWFTNIEKTQFDLIVSNPPYVAKDDLHLQQGDLRFEPQHALIAANNGLSDILMITKTALDYLKPSGQLLIEHGCEQQQAVQGIFQQFRYRNIKTHRDLANLPRVTSAQASS
jgi:release factor glutamine methyltransferase